MVIQNVNEFVWGKGYPDEQYDEVAIGETKIEAKTV